MAKDHRGRPVHAGKRTNDAYPKIRFNESLGIATAIHSDFEEQHGRRMTRSEHNETFTPPGDTRPMVDYPYSRFNKTRVTPTRAVNPPPKRRNAVPKMKTAATEEQKANRDIFW